jgi:hypothetical protein
VFTAAFNPPEVVPPVLPPVLLSAGVDVGGRVLLSVLEIEVDVEVNVDVDDDDDVDVVASDDSDQVALPSARSTPRRLNHSLLS